MVIAGLTALYAPPLARAIDHRPKDFIIPSSTRPYSDCPHGTCDAISEPPIIRTKSGYKLPFSASNAEGTGEKGGYDPKDLQSAYRIPATGGSTQTVAVIDAWGDGTAESDLAKYREKYGLPACTKANGCFKKVNQKGEEGSYPPEEETWAVETSLDVDMVSAACPECHILLVEASGELPTEMGTSVEEAVKLGATEISNSYSFPETYKPWCGESDCTQYSSYYNHPGIVMTASAGDYKYDNESFGGLSKPAPSFPASSPNVIAVGGTKLNKASNSRGWAEVVWNEPGFNTGSGSGCSLTQSKPSWQTDSGCAKRTENDIAAVGACETPVSIYSTRRYAGWGLECGTSASAPLIAGIEAHAEKAIRSLAAEVFYGQPGDEFDVTVGSDGACGGSYLCTAGIGYDGPTGMGSPDGVPGPPSAITGSASKITDTGATLNGTVNPNEIETKYYFEYGHTTSYGTKTAESSAGSGSNPVAVSSAITGLAPATTYHFRVVATSTHGTSYGEDKAFTTTTYWISWSGAGSTLETYSPGTGVTNTGVKIYSGSSPAITTLSGGGYEVAFESPAGLLYTYTPSSGAVNTTEHMRPGTSPSIAAVSGGGYEIAFQAEEGNLYTWAPVAGAFNTTEKMRIGTSPSIAAVSGGGYEIAFQAEEGNLYTWAPVAGAFNTTEKMRIGTSPGITGLPNSGYEVAFQGEEGYLYTWAPVVGAFNTSKKVRGATSPGIAGLPNSGYEVAFQGEEGNLYTWAPAVGAFNTTEKMSSFTSPGIAGLPGGGYEIAFQAEFGELWTWAPGTGAVNLHVSGLTPGASPSVSE